MCIYKEIHKYRTVAMMHEYLFGDIFAFYYRCSHRVYFIILMAYVYIFHEKFRRDKREGFELVYIICVLVIIYLKPNIYRLRDRLYIKLKTMLIYNRYISSKAAALTIRIQNVHLRNLVALIKNR